jgi:[protein-PII] uridylyltransferase
LADRPRGLEFGRRWSDALDAACLATAALVDLPDRWALVALGSYARRELCPGSDVDVMLVHDGKSGAVAAAADTLWYPLWDAGLVLGHSVRTPKEALSLAGEEIDALTILLDARTVAGDPVLASRLVEEGRALARRRRSSLVRQLAAATVARRDRPGPIAEMLEPNLKDGAGGLRDVQSLEWAGWSLGEPGGTVALEAAGHLQPADLQVLGRARAALLDARVALHLVTGTRGDVLLLQEQDATARELGAPSTDDLVRELASHGRAVTWLLDDVWRRLDGVSRGPSGRIGRRDRAVAPGVVLRDGAVTLGADANVDALAVLRAAEAAAQRRVPIERASLERMRQISEVSWDDEARHAFVGLLRAGHRSVPVVESLDQAGVMARLLPEWDHVRARPQRNAYHRFTVDRHLLEAVAQCAAILDEQGFDGEVAARVRPELLLLGALLHDIAKGMPGDHSEVGAEVARTVANRIGLDARGTDVLAWLVRHHLLLADTATRRDLTDERTIVRFGRAVSDTERLDLLYILTIGDSRATGPAAWSSAKAALVRQLFVETDTLLERGVVSGRAAAAREEALARHQALLDGGVLATAWREGDDGLLECTVVAPDRTGLLATVAGVLALHGFDIHGASAYGADSGMALEVFRGVDAFGRLDADGQAAVERDVRAALAGELPLRARLEERIKRYPQERSARAEGVRVAFDLEASSAATVVEVHAPDEVALLSRVAAVFADLDLDVTAALVSTLGARVVDVFYVRDRHGAKLTDPSALDRLRATLVARLSADALLA